MEQSLDDKTISQEKLLASASLRGEILGKVILLESMMDLFLANYFCKSKELVNQILETVFATKKFRYDSKIDTILAITKNKDLNKWLKDIGEHRNVFAHYPVNFISPGMEAFKADKIIGFIKFNNSETEIQYTADLIDTIRDLIVKAIREMQKNIDLVISDSAH